MSRVLPPRASLEHLKNQARQRLRMMQQQRSSAKLSDAQHAIAREYGFASWPKLKAHVESLPEAGEPVLPPAASASGGSGGRDGGHAVTTGGEPPASDYGFTRYGQLARQAVFFSRFEATVDRSATIDPEHLLLGLIRAAQGTRVHLFDRRHLSLDDARAAIGRERPAGEPPGGFAHIPFSPSARQALRHAVEEADRLQHDTIRLAHLLLGILSEASTLAAAIVEQRGLTRDALRAAIDDHLAEDAV